MKTQTQIMEINVMLKHLKMAMQKCSIWQDILDLEYDPDREEVKCTYENLGEQMTTYVNVACDSNSAMIYDVVNRLNHFFS